jgi:hypothetical protein
MILKDASLTINGVDLSDHGLSVTLNYKSDEKDDSAFGDDTRVRVCGVKEWDISITFKQDYAAGKVDATLFDLVGAAAFTVAVKPTSGATSATNPCFTGSCILTDYKPLAGGWGDRLETSITLLSASDLSRAVV